MLSSRVTKKLYQSGFAITKATDRFIAVLREALVELGGQEWQKSDLPVLFRQLTKEVVGPLCNDPEGPRLGKDIFARYMNAAKKSLLFGIPFRLAVYLSIADLAVVKAKVDADTRPVSTEEKVTDAIASLHKERRTPVEQHKVQVDFDQLDAVVARHGKELRKAKKFHQPLPVELGIQLLGCLIW